MSSKMKIRHVIGLVNCLACLQNFCIVVNRNHRQPLCDPIPKDMVHLMFGTGGYVPFVVSPGADVPLPIDLILGDLKANVPSFINHRQRRDEHFTVVTLPRKDCNAVKSNSVKYGSTNTKIKILIIIIINIDYSYNNYHYYFFNNNIKLNRNSTI